MTQSVHVVLSNNRSGEQVARINQDEGNESPFKLIL